MRMVASTGVGFVFSPVPEGLEPQAQNGLANFVAAHMYERRITRCIGAAFVNEGASRFVWWVMFDQPWKHDAQMEAFLQSHIREWVLPSRWFRGTHSWRTGRSDGQNIALQSSWDSAGPRLQRTLRATSSV